MSESTYGTSAASAGANQLTFSSPESANNSEAAADSAGFTTVLADYIESDQGLAKQQMDENLAQLMNELLPQEVLVDGNFLPQAEDTEIWQALLLLQPAENATTNSPSVVIQSNNLPGNNKSAFNSTLLNQDYFHSLTAQDKEADSLIPKGMVMNNNNSQLVTPDFIAAAKESVLLNINEQHLPVQGANSGLSQGLAAVGFGSVTQAANTQTQMMPLNLGQNAWETNLGSRLQMLVGQNVQTAEIRLDPPELGAIDIKIKITNDIATVSLSSSHAQVREALETAVPKLREMFDESGLTLGDVNVRQESFSQQQNSAEAEEKSIALSQTALSETGDDPSSVSRKIVSDNLLDIYA